MQNVKWGILLGLVASGALWAAPAWACSGPGAMAAIEQAVLQGWIMWGVAVVLGFLSMALGRWSGLTWGKSWWPMLVAGAHPGWWLTARGGDCGSMLVWGSTGMLAVMILLTLVIAIMAVIRRRRTRGLRCTSC